MRKTLNACTRRLNHPGPGRWHYADDYITLALDNLEPKRRGIQLSSCRSSRRPTKYQVRVVRVWHRAGLFEIARRVMRSLLYIRGGRTAFWRKRLRH